MKIPLLNIPVVYHIGTLNKANKASFHKKSQEGEGLSVSLCPNAWQEITHLPGNLYSLEFESAQYIDYKALEHETKFAIIQWAVNNDFAEWKTVWQIWSYDDESDEWKYMEFNDYRKALLEIDIDVNGDIEGQIAELDDEFNMQDSPKGTILTENKILSITTKGHSVYSGFVEGDNDDMSVIIWLKEVLSLDYPDIVGVWWNENYDPLCWSAPRGVILHDRLIDFKISIADVSFDDEEILETMPESIVVEMSYGLKLK